MAPASRGHRDTSGSLDFWRHIEDFRRMLLWSVLGWGAGTLVAWNWWQELWTILSHPLHTMPNPPKIVVTSPTATVTMSIQLALVAGSMLSAPWIFWQIWRFAAPAMMPREKSIAVWALLWTSALFAAGSATAYFTILPMTLRWLAEYGDGLFEQLWNVGEYTTMSVKMLAAFGAMFEFPLVTYVLGSFGVLTSKQLLSWSRGAIVAIFVLAAVLTPPDPVSQCMMAAPMLVLYFAGVATAGLGARSAKGKS